MGKWYDQITPSLIEWVKEQKLFFVATAPLDGRGCVNVSPKGHDCFRILGPNQVCYLELTGSGIETQSHLEENGRITFMFTAFVGGPRIMRLIGTGRVVRFGSPEFDQVLKDHFHDSDLLNAPGKRAIIFADIRKVGTSCGYAVPFFDYREERPTLINEWAKREDKDSEYLPKYWLATNKFSLDGLPGMRHEDMGPEWQGKNRGPGEPIILPDWSISPSGPWYSPLNIKRWFWTSSGSGLTNASILFTGIALGAAIASRITRHS